MIESKQKIMEMNHMKLLNLSLKKSAVITPSEYIRLYNKHPESIESVSAILPRIGLDSHFGLFKVVYAPEHYEVANNAKI